MLPLPLSAAAILLCLSVQLEALAAPQSGPGQVAGQTMLLRKRVPASRTIEEWGVWAKEHREGLLAKYGHKTLEKRTTSGTNLMTNQNGDSSYFGNLAVGTPPQSYNVILDSGSSDLWLADSNCTAGCDGVPTFSRASSSTFQDQNTSFSISYGSGQASGSLGKDVIQMAGFSVENQVIALCNLVSKGLLLGNVSGLLGLGFASIASSKATPLWQTLVESGAWDSPLMSFQLTRYINSTYTKSEEPGGSFSMGFANTSLFTGDIDYVDMPVEGSYWILAITSIIVQGNTISLPSGDSSYAAIDTGTTLVGGPADVIAAIFAQIPGSKPGTGSFENYYTYPCDTVATVQLSFGSKYWTIDPVDFRLTRLNGSDCLGAFFVLPSGSSAPSWIIGDTFLKNVFTVFRYKPLSIGFAQLSDIALAQNGAPDGEAPSATTGSAAVTVAATSPNSTPSKVGSSSAASSLIHHHHHPSSTHIIAFCTASLVAAAGYLL